MERNICSSCFRFQVVCLVYKSQHGLLKMNKYPAQLSWAILILALSHYLLNAAQLLNMKIVRHFSLRVLGHLYFSVNTVCSVTIYRFLRTLPSWNVLRGQSWKTNLKISIAKLRTISGDKYSLSSRAQLLIHL